MNQVCPVEKIEGAAYRLTAVTQQLKLLAFAVEARRTLESIRSLANLMPEIEKTLSEGTPAWRNWDDFEDVSGEALRSLAFDTDELQTIVDQAATDIRTANLTSNTRQAAKGCKQGQPVSV
ncbi:hypothetical protein PSQ20_21730 [Curvibacter sp. RS43]|uniref:hypothetical protein n=1 Tax=Curvibacter microcysteis TaxID=3026419 RepID=UPI0023617520|nr:hypothetical protein [Curvibacter sp. RS43]MDD0812971.1 hypothetical protein [Curvibacter sp. RS43]